MLNNLNLGLEIMCAFVFGILGSIVIAVFILVLVNRILENGRLFKNTVKDIGQVLVRTWYYGTQISALNIYLLFFGILIWYILIISQNNIKTNKVSVLF